MKVLRTAQLLQTRTGYFEVIGIGVFCGVINFEHCQDIIKDILTAPAIHTRIFVFDLPNSGYM